MDFILPASLPACGIPWEKVLPPLLPRLNAVYGAQCGWNQLVTPTSAQPCSLSSTQVDCDSSGFTVQVDVRLFRPEELLVKVTGDFVEVQGKHQETKRDGPGVITRQFNRRYRIPEGVDSLALESAVSPEGILVISAPLLQLPACSQDPAAPCLSAPQLQACSKDPAAAPCLSAPPLQLQACSKDPAAPCPTASHPGTSSSSSTPPPPPPSHPGTSLERSNTKAE